MIFLQSLIFILLNGNPLPHSPQPSENTQPGNIIIILADDLGIDMLASYGIGSDAPPTPNIDQLVQSGILFRNAWSNPVCTPTRATLQTGRYGFRTGLGKVDQAIDPIPLSLNEITLPEMLDMGTNQAYAHAAFGKWHLGNTDSVGGYSAPNLAGYSHFVGAMGNIGDYFSYDRVRNGVLEHTLGYATSDTIDEALAWLQTSTEPFYMGVFFNAPHNPFHAPPANLLSAQTQQDLMGKDPLVEPRPFYKAAIEAMDTEIGRLVSTLSANQQLSNTTIIFLGDNGTAEGIAVAPFDPNRSKNTVYEGGIHIPFIVSGPLVQQPASECQALVNVSDIFASTAEIAAVDLQTVLPTDYPLDSVSFIPYLQDPGAPSIRPWIFSESFSPNRPEGKKLRTTFGPNACQEDLGFAGPGNVTISICGGILTETDDRELVLTAAPANTTVYLFIATALNPIPYLGGTLAANPYAAIKIFQTDTNGELHISALNNIVFTSNFFIQAVVEDPAQIMGFSLSNALHIVQESDVKVIRNSAYKLIVPWNSSAMEEFFDLVADPFENNNLLLGTLNLDEQANYQALKDQLQLLLPAKTPSVISKPPKDPWKNPPPPP